MSSTDATTATATSSTSLPIGKLIALDPGKTTGYAEWTQAGGWVAEELTVAEVFARITYEAAKAEAKQQAIQLISESFMITVNTAKNSQAGWSLELIGVFKYVAWGNGWPELKLQSPGVAKGFATDAKLRHMGWWTKGRGGHANDASRHLLTFCATRQPWADTIIGRQRLMELADV